MGSPKLPKQVRYEAKRAMFDLVGKAKESGEAFRLSDLQVAAAGPIARAYGLPIPAVKTPALDTANNFLRKYREKKLVVKSPVGEHSYYLVGEPII